MNKRRLKIVFPLMLILGTLIACFPLKTDIPSDEWSESISVSGLFGDNMVLQRNTKVNIWGWGTPGKYVNVMLGDKLQTLKVDDQGKWQAVFKTGKAGKTVSMKVCAKDTIKIDNIIFGDVWLCAGQSNMEMPLAGWGRVQNYQQEINAAVYNDIRLFRSNNSKIQYTYTAEEKVRTVKGWELCTPESVEEFSAVAYFFGRKIYKNTGVPIGLVQATSGGTPVEAWMPRELCKIYDDIYSRMNDVIDGDIEYDKMRERDKKNDIEAWYDGTKMIDKSLSASIPWYASQYDDSQWTLIPDLPDGFWDDHGFEETKGVFWYRKTIELPASFLDRSSFIRIGQIYERNELYVNGTYIGEFTSNAQPSEYIIPEGVLQQGRNLIAVRIQANRTNGGMRGLPEDYFIASVNDTVSLRGAWRIAKSFDYKNYLKAPVNISLKRRPTIVYNALINPLIPLTIKGMLWYQGESNMNNSEVYGEYIKAMIREYRVRWNKDIPVYFVQIANYLKNSPADKLPWLREAQCAALALPDVHMISAIDIGSKHDVHPKNKQDVGKRLADMALKYSYGHKALDADHPEIVKVVFDRNEAIINLKKTGKLRLIKGETPQGFEIFSEETGWCNADADITNGKIILSHPDVSMPTHIRHAWCNNPHINVTDQSGLPLLPFRTDDFKRINQ